MVNVWRVSGKAQGLASACVYNAKTDETYGRYMDRKEAIRVRDELNANERIASRYVQGKPITIITA